MIDNITEYAINKKLFGGGGGKREGTAIDPKGTSEIYLNTSNTIEETNALLSQLTYVQTDLLSYPVYPVYYGSGYGQVKPLFMFVVNVNDNYSIHCTEDHTSGKSICIYDSSSDYDKNGWLIGNFISDLSDLSLWCVPAVIGTVGIGTTELLGIPIGAENEKIKNVLSSTPF